MCCRFWWASMGKDGAPAMVKAAGCQGVSARARAAVMRSGMACKAGREAAEVERRRTGVTPG